MYKYVKSPYIWLVLIFGFVLLAILFAFSPAYAGKSPFNDSGLYLYFGSRINAGAVPYRDLWDNKPPLTFYIDALGLLLSGGSIWGVWILEVLSLVVAGTLLILIFKKRFAWPVVLLVLVSFISNLAPVLQGGNLTEEYALPFQCAGLYLFTRLDPQSKRPWVAILLGGAFSMAFLSKQTSISVWIALAIYIILDWLLGKKPVFWRHWLWAAVGAGLVLGIWVLYFLSQKALVDFWEIAFSYNFLYSGMPLEQHVQALLFFFTSGDWSSAYLIAGLVAWLAVLAATFIAGWRKIPGLLLVALVDFPLECLMISASGQVFLHYLIAIQVCLAILFGYVINFLFQGLQSRTKYPLGYILLTVILILAAIPGIQAAASAYKSRPPKYVFDTVKYIQSHTNQDDYVLLWGTRATINFLSGRLAPTRFVHQMPFYMKGYAGRQLTGELLHDLQTRPPKLIIDTRNGAFPFLIVNPKGGCSNPSEPLAAGLPEVFAYICRNYYRAGTVNSYDWVVYSYLPAPDK